MHRNTSCASGTYCKWWPRCSGAALLKAAVLRTVLWTHVAPSLEIQKTPQKKDNKLGLEKPTGRLTEKNAKDTYQEDLRKVENFRKSYSVNDLEKIQLSKSTERLSISLRPKASLPTLFPIIFLFYYSPKISPLPQGEYETSDFSLHWRHLCDTQCLTLEMYRENSWRQGVHVCWRRFIPIYPCTGP